MSEAELSSEKFQQELESAQELFDPFDIDESFASLFEGVIRPLEADFEENVLSEIRASFNVGAGGSLATSGAAKDAEAQARRSLAFETAGLRADERNTAIGRAYADFDRRVNNLQLGFNARQGVTNAKLGVGDQLYGSASDTAAATSAFGGAIQSQQQFAVSTVASILGSAGGGSGAAQSPPANVGSKGKNQETFLGGSSSARNR